MLIGLDIVILCIGSEKVCGDMVGPLVGESLINDYNLPVYVYGNLSNSANGINIEEYYNLIARLHSNCVLITIDAAVGNYADIGTIRLKQSGVSPGAALGRKLNYKSIGVIGVVAPKYGNVLNNLLVADYGEVLSISSRITHIINNSLIPIVLND